MSATDKAKVVGKMEFSQEDHHFCPEEGGKITAKATLSPVTLNLSAAMTTNLSMSCSLVTAYIGAMGAISGEVVPIYGVVHK